MRQAIQITESFRSWDEAYEALRALALQWGYLGGRVLPPGKDAAWRLQAFVEDNPHAGDTWLPDGCRRVLLPQGVAKALQLRA